MNRREYQTLQTKAKMPLSYRRRVKKPTLKEIPGRYHLPKSHRIKIVQQKYTESNINEN